MVAVGEYALRWIEKEDIIWATLSIDGVAVSMRNQNVGGVRSLVVHQDSQTIGYVVRIEKTANFEPDRKARSENILIAADVVHAYTNAGSIESLVTNYTGFGVHDNVRSIFLADMQKNAAVFKTRLIIPILPNVHMIVGGRIRRD